jgi:hypothetical protein
MAQIVEAMRGRARLRKVFWGYCILGTVTIGVLLFGVFRVAIRIDPSPHHFLTDAVTGVLFVAYFLWAHVSLWTCAFNARHYSGRHLLLRRYFRQLWVKNGDDLVCPAAKHAGFGGLTIGRVQDAIARSLTIEQPILHAPSVQSRLAQHEALQINVPQSLPTGSEKPVRGDAKTVDTARHEVVFGPDTTLIPRPTTTVSRTDQRSQPVLTDIQRERAMMLGIFEAPHNLPLVVFAKLAGKSRPQINREIEGRRLLSLAMGNRGQCIPDWQLDPVRQQFIDPFCSVPKESMAGPSITLCRNLTRYWRDVRPWRRLICKTDMRPPGLYSARLG